VFEYAVAEAVPCHIRRCTATGQQRGRPEAAAFLVADVIRLGVRIADRVIRPRRETERLCVLAPGIGAPALRDEGSERWVRQHVHPRCRRHLSGRGRDDVLASVRTEAADPVVEEQVALSGLFRQRGGCTGFAGTATRGGRWGARNRRWRAPFELLRQRTVAIAEDNPGNRLQKNGVPFEDLVGRAHEDPAGLIDAVGVEAGGDQLRDLFDQGGVATALPLAEDHEVHRQSVQAPIRVAGYKLARQIDIRRVCNAQQHDRQIAGNGIGPQTRPALAIPAENARVGAQRSVGVDDRTGKTCVEPRIRFAGLEPAQDRLATRRRHCENAIGNLPILVSLDQCHTRLACPADAADQIDDCGFTRIERDGTADRGHRIEHRARAPRQCRVVVQRLRISRGAAATDEAHAIRLIGDLSPCRLGRGQQMKHPGRRLAGSARTARAQDRLALGQDFGFDKQFAERRMCGVGGGRREHDFRVTRYIKRPACERTVGDADPAQLDIIFH